MHRVFAVFFWQAEQSLCSIGTRYARAPLWPFNFGLAVSLSSKRGLSGLSVLVQYDEEGLFQSL